MRPYAAPVWRRLAPCVEGSARETPPAACLRPVRPVRRLPFSWKPDLVEVLDSGTLAESIGSVSAPDGTVVARFYSTWRREAGCTWRVVFDNGYDMCDCAPPK